MKKVYCFLCISAVFMLSSCYTNEFESSSQEQPEEDVPHGLYAVLDTIDSEQVKATIYNADENGFAIANFADGEIKQLNILNPTLTQKNYFHDFRCAYGL